MTFKLYNLFFQFIFKILHGIVDRQGDPILERAVAQMIQQGDFQRHSKKALKLYKERRDHFCHLLESELGDFIEFKVPEGGMAVWVGLNKDMHWRRIAERCFQKGLRIPNWELYDQQKTGHNHIRMGFASLNFEEQEKIVGIIRNAMMAERAMSLVSVGV